MISSSAPTIVGGLHVFRYAKPTLDRPKVFTHLVRSGMLRANVQVVREGGENNLHAHPHTDGFWFVLKGRARFYGAADDEVVELGPNEDVLVPRGAKYWFERTGIEDLELLQVSATDLPPSDVADRVDYTPRKV